MEAKPLIAIMDIVSFIVPNGDSVETEENIGRMV